jgi:hypothetical protein
MAEVSVTSEQEGSCDIESTIFHLEEDDRLTDGWETWECETYDGDGPSDLDYIVFDQVQMALSVFAGDYSIN